MNKTAASALIAKFAEKQMGKHYACPRCGGNTMNTTPTRNALSRALSVYICDTCGMDEAIRDFAHAPKPLCDWAIIQHPKDWDMVQTYYYTFGTDPLFPHQNGWVEVVATSWAEAHEKFRSVYPDRRPNVLNCAFFYEEERWQRMNPPKNWPGYECYGVIE